MHNLEDGPPVGEQPAELLRRLELTAMSLWADEPICDIDDRPGLLTRLGAASETIERLAFRHDVHPDEPTDTRALEVCAAELEELGRHWPQSASSAATRAAKLAA